MLCSEVIPRQLGRVGLQVESTVDFASWVVVKDSCWAKSSSTVELEERL